jgi:hypothetical protein
MPDQDKQNPPTGSESDISKSQSQQQPPAQANQQQPEEGQQAGQFETGQQGQAEFAQDRPDATDADLQGDTLAEKRTDIEGASQRTPEKGEAESGFVGAEGRQDTSSELVEDELDEDDQSRSQGE